MNAHLKSSRLICLAGLLLLSLAASASADVVTQYSFESNLWDTASAGSNFDLLTPILVGGTGEESYLPGVVGDAVKLGFAAGSAFVLQAPTSDDLNLAPNWTLEAFVRPDGRNTGEWDRFWTKWAEPVSGGLPYQYHWAFRYGNNGSDLFLGNAGGTTNVLNGGPANPNNTVPLNRWSHVALVGDQTANTITAYINGDPVASAPYVAPVPGSSNMNFGNFATGAPSGANFTGLIDEALIHDTARDAAYMQSRADLLPDPVAAQPLYENNSHRMAGAGFFGNGRGQFAYIKTDGSIKVVDHVSGESRTLTMPNGESAVKIVGADLNGYGQAGLAIIGSAAGGLYTYDFAGDVFVGPVGGGVVDLSAANIDADPRDEVMGVTGPYVGIFENGAWGANVNNGSPVIVANAQFNADPTKEFITTSGTNLYYYDGETNAWTQYAGGSAMNDMTAGNVETSDGTAEVLVRTPTDYWFNDDGAFTNVGFGKSPMDAGRVDGDLAAGQEFFYVMGGNDVIYQGNNWDAAPGNSYISVPVDASTGTGTALDNAGWSDFLLVDVDGDGLEEILARTIADPDVLYVFNNGDARFTVVPEPSSIALAVFGLLGVVWTARRRGR